MFYLKYLWHVIRHKWWVFVECLHYGLVWEGIVHDLSKFSPVEFVPYAKRYYGGDVTGGGKYDQAWQHHWMNNKHHHQWWHYHRYGERVPVKYLQEMVCDYRAMARTRGRPPGEWFTKNRDYIHLHYLDLQYIEGEVNRPL